MSKPNRNDLCPYESGENFKKCCLNVTEYLRNWPNSPSNQRPATPSFFAKNGAIDLLLLAARLSILPQNHGKNVRLELRSMAVMEKSNPSAVRSSKSELKSFLDEHYASNLFTDLVSYHGNDYLIFPDLLTA
jgi:hypothetical protein